MKISTEIRSSAKKIGEEKTIEYLAKICNQSHAPFPTSCKEIRSYFVDHVRNQD